MESIALAAPLSAEARCIGKPLVIMTRNPWEVTQATGYPSVQIPNGSLADILAVAHRYRVTDIELNGSRRALNNKASLLAPGGPFTRSRALGRNFYRVKSEAGQPRC